MKFANSIETRRDERVAANSARERPTNLFEFQISLLKSSGAKQTNWTQDDTDDDADHDDNFN